MQECQKLRDQSEVGQGQTFNKLAREYLIYTNNSNSRDYLSN